MAVEDGVFEVLATTGDMLLGGQDFDRTLALKLAAEVDREHGIDLLSDPVATQRLISEAEETKKLLTELERVTIGLPFLAMGPGLGDFGQPHQDGACDHEGQCVLLGIWNKAGDHMRAYLEGFTLAGIADIARGQAPWP
jgi:hypothetical protein